MGDFWSRRTSYRDAGTSGDPARPPAAAPPHADFAAPDAPTPAAPHPLGGPPHSGFPAPARGAPAFTAPAPPHPADTAPPGLPAPAPQFPPPSGPPARVGSAVAALLCAVATLLCPVLFFLLGFPVLVLLVNAPAIAFGIVALTRTSEPMEVERYIRYTWACILVYLALMAVILIAAIMVILSL